MPADMRTLILPTALLLTIARLHAQELHGALTYPTGGNQRLVLWSTVGADHVRFDSTTTDANGRFTFPVKTFPTGFYQLSVNDSDRVDIILDPEDEEVLLEIDGTPLQYHLVVRRSEENKRLWAYKVISHEAQVVQHAAQQERMALQPTEVTRMRELDSIQYMSQLRQQDQLTRLVTGAPRSYFARTVGTSRMLDVAMRDGSSAMAATFPFSDPDMLRSSVFDKAVGIFLQASPPRTEKEFYARVDSLVLLASGDKECRTHVLAVLVDMFATYGPDLALQHVVDTHIAGRDPSDLPTGILARVKDLLATTTGAIAPDMALPRLEGDSVRISDLVKGNRYTVLFFYSSGCDHCHQQMPVLLNTYANYRPKGLGVVGIALDTDTTEFLRTIQDEHLSWPCYSEFQAWGSPAAKAFHVGATPGFFLLDPQRRIVAKPVDAADLDLLLAPLLR